jgi:hypothetical protein
MRGPAEPPGAPTQHALLLVPALASVSAHTAAFHRRYWARPRSRVQCRCAALAGGRAGRGGHCCCCDRESNCRQAGARAPLRHLLLRAAALYVSRASAARGWRGSRARRRRCWVVLRLWGAVSSGERRLDARRPPRNHSRAIFEPFTRSNVVRAVGDEARSVCWCSCHHRWVHLGRAGLALARRRCSQHDHRALHGAAAARVRSCQSLVSRGTGGTKRHIDSTRDSRRFRTARRAA